MTSAEASKKGRRFWDSLFQREDVLEVAEAIAGDVQADRAVHVVAAGGIAGDVIAPNLKVDGFVHGLVLARHVVVAPGGQLWGDVFAVEMEVHAGGRMHGWVTTIAEEDYETLRVRASEGEWPRPEDVELRPEWVPAELETAVTTPVDRTQWLGLLRWMQQEAGQALYARAILEREFMAKVEAAAGDAVERADALEEATRALRAERLTLVAALDEAADALQGREDELAEQALALQRLQENRREDATALADAQRRARLAAEQLVALEAVNRELESRLAQTLEQAERLRSRVDSLESALRASVQHNAEQEDALLRWQELADTTQEEVGTLRSRLAALELDLIARDAELTDLRTQEETVTGQDGGGDSAPSAHLAPEGVPSDLRTEEGKALDAALASLQQQQEQILWYKTSMRAAENQLQEAQQRIVALQEQLRLAEEEAATAAALAEKWKERVGHISDLLYASEEKVKALETGGPQSAAALRHQLEERDARVAALESSQRQLEEDLAAATQQLDQMQAQLRARETSLAEMRAEIEQRARDVENVRAQARIRIRQLREELARARKR